MGFLGLREGGVRVTVDLPDEPGALVRVAEAGPPSNIIAVVTAGVVEGERRRMVLRAIGDEAGDFAERVRARGFHVRDVR